MALQAMRPRNLALDDVWMQGERLLMNGQEQEGLQKVMQAADAGNTAALNALGCFYSEGMFGLPLDPKRGQDYLEAAAEAGAQEAYTNLANYLRHGLYGYEQDKRLAANLLKKGVEAGHYDAMGLLAEMHMQGDGIPQDTELGTKMMQEMYRHPETQARLKRALEQDEAGTLKMIQDGADGVKQILHENPDLRLPTQPDGNH